MKCEACKMKNTPRDEESKKKLISRINRINGIKKMIEEDRYRDDVLIQLSAIDKAIKGLANEILDEHMKSCVIENIQKGNYEVLDEIVTLFKRFQ